MQKLIQYHTVMADIKHFWTNVEVGKELQICKLETYAEYLKCCNRHGVIPYNEETFNEYKEQHFEVNKKYFKKD